MRYRLEMHEQFNTPRSAEQAFSYIVDFSKIDEWDHTISDAAKVSDGDIGLGSQFELTFSMGGRKTPISYQITKFEPSHTAVLTGVSDRFTAIDTVNIEQNNHGCKVSWQAEINFSGLTALLMPLMANKVKAVGAKTIRDLNKKLDQMAASDSAA